MECIHFSSADKSEIPAHPAWAVNADERAHVVACLLVDENRSDDGENGSADEPANSPIEPVRKWARGGAPPDDIGFWVQLLNADKSGGHASTRFEREWIAERTYTRWLHYGTAYGFTDHSMAMLSTPCTEPPTWRHFGQMYFDQLLLMLYVRSSIFRFSRRLSEISIAGRKADAHADFSALIGVREEFSKLRRQFDWFTNLYRFPLLSTQQQAIEMFNKLAKGLDIEEIYKEVESEVDGTHEVLELEAAQRFARIATLLGLLGAAGILAGVIQTILTLSGLANDQIPWWGHGIIWLLIALACTGFVGYLILSCWAGRWVEALLTRYLEPKSRAKPCCLKPKRP